MNRFFFYIIIFSIILSSCRNKEPNTKAANWDVQIIESSSRGKKLEIMDLSITDLDSSTSYSINIDPNTTYQEIIGFGGAFTEASSYCLDQLSESNRRELIQAYFSKEGANYSLCRTHVGSCDFSLDHYAYAKEEDFDLKDFSIERDLKSLIPMIKHAQEQSKDGFKLIASPWTAPPWMKTNNSWEAGSLKEIHYPTFSKYILKYIQAYEELGIPIWMITPENEPLGNDSNWDSMHFTKEQMAILLQFHLGPLIKDSTSTGILIFDQNRDEELIEWSNYLLSNPELSKYIDGTAIHWYASTVDPMTEAIDELHRMAKDKLIIPSEACIDNDVPIWKDDQWYWTENATDWGYDWAAEEDKYLHPKYVAAHRYASDIIATLNHSANGWVDWNMILDRKGGPNHAENWCIAPVIVDTEADEIYYTPLYYVMAQFSKYIRPGAFRIEVKSDEDQLMQTAFINKDGTISLVVFNPTNESRNLDLSIKGKLIKRCPIEGNSIQTINFKENN